MEIDVLEQAYLFAGALLLGLGAGLLYDCMRVLRHRLDWLWLSHILDALFWLAVTLALFTYSLTKGDGRVRVFYIAAFCLGGGLYFLTLGRLVLLLLNRIADGIAFLWRILCIPVNGLVGLGKKFAQMAKKLFHCCRKWFTIRVASHRPRKPTERERYTMRIEKAALTTKLVILALLIAVSLALLSVRSRLDAAQEELDAVTRQVQAQTDINADLADDIATSGVGESILDIARERLGLVQPDEQVFVDANH